MITSVLPRGRGGRELAAIVATASLASVTISLAVPLLSLVLHAHGIDSFTIGLNSAASALGSLAILPFADGLARRFGALAAMRAALLIAAAVLLLFPLAVDLVLWAFWRVLLGAVGSVLFVLSEAAINALAPPASRGRVLALYATAFSLGYALGPLLLAVVGSEGPLPFVLASLFLVFAAVPLRWAPDIDGLLVAPGEPGDRPRARMLFHRAALSLMGVFVYAALEAGFFALLPVYLVAIGETESRAGLLLSLWIAGNLLLQLPIGWLADRLGAQRTLGLCAGLSLLALVALDGAARSGPLIWPLLLVGGGTMGALYTLSLALLGERFAPRELVRANASFVAAFQFGLLLGPVAVGASMHGLGAETFGWTLALLCGALLFGAVVARARPGLARGGGRAA
ncbi:MAG: MFS transporter [Geminicoccaceae bacterium]|nr:MFS transporter [Geminicoccaceae bacterium]